MWQDSHSTSDFPSVRSGEAGGLHVLIINSYDDTSSSSKSNKVFSEMVASLVGQNARIVRRKLDDLADYCVSFEYDILTEASKAVTRRFDKLDLVFLGGDMKEMPWSPRATQLVTFLRMCHVCRKAVFSCGGGAFHSMFNLATQGRRYSLLNAPNGDVLSRLASFARYAQGTAKHGCGWLDNETGDVYEYDPHVNSWRPATNLGFYRSPVAGTPGHDRLRPPDKVHGSSLRASAAAQAPEAVEEREEVLQIPNVALQHPLLRKMPAPKFVLATTQNWYFNTDGALPGCSGGSGHGGLQVLAESRRGPVLFSYDRSVLLGAEIEPHGTASLTSHRYIRRLMKNFVKGSVEKLWASAADINLSLFALLFGAHGEGGGALATFAPVIMAAPMAISTISSALGRGPTRGTVTAIDPAPATVLASRPPAAFPENVDNEALTSPRQHYTLGKKVHVAARHPTVARQKRMDLFLSSAGHAELQGVCKAVQQAAQMKGRERGLYNLGASGEGSPAAGAGAGAVPELALGRLQLGSAEEDQPIVIMPNSSRYLFGENLAYLDGKKRVAFEQQERDKEAALLLGNAGGIEYRPGTGLFEDTGRRRKLTDPLDRRLLEPERDGARARPKSAGPANPNPNRPKSAGPVRFHAAREADKDKAQQQQQQGQQQGQGEAPAAFPTASKDVYDVYVHEMPRLGSRDRPHTASVGRREAYSQLSQAMRGEHLPLRHPVAPPVRIPDVSPSKTSQRRQDKKQQQQQQQQAKNPAAAAAPGQEGSLAEVPLGSNGLRGQRQGFKEVLKVVVIPGQDASKFHNNYKKFEKMVDVDASLNSGGEYVGQYTEIYRTPLEREIFDYNETKRTFLAGPFKTHFGVASSLPLRKEGQIRPQGPYPVAPQGCRGVPALDWNMMPAEDSAKRLGGQWKK